MTGQPLEILIIEDVDAMRELLALLVNETPGLRSSGTARSTWEARIELSRRRPQLVLLDVILPGESGLNLLPELKSLRIPVILLTSESATEGPLPEGVVGRLAKPGWKSLEATRESLLALIKKQG